MVAKIERLNNEKGGKLRSIVEAVNRLNPLAEATQRAHVKSLTNPGSLVHADVHAIRQELRQLLGTYALAAECGWPAAERVYQRAEDSAKWAALSVDPKGSMTELTAVRQEQLTEQARRERERERKPAAGGKRPAGSKPAAQPKHKYQREAQTAHAGAAATVAGDAAKPYAGPASGTRGRSN